ncbi:MAG: LrgB family protein [Alphaproteobacteria bacterium]
MAEILSNPLTSLLVTLCAFYGFSEIQKRAGGHSMLNPVVWAIIICVAFVSVSGISYEGYMEGAGVIHFLLGPVTVALAVLLYRLLYDIAKDAKAIVITLLVGCLLSAFGAMALVMWLGGSEEIQLAILSKSVTAPIAIGIAQKIGTAESLAVLFVFATNIPWLLLSVPILKAIGVKDEESQGIALGTVCHGLGVAQAFQIGKRCGTYAVIGMSLMGIFSGVLIPVLVLIFVL